MKLSIRPLKDLTVLELMFLVENDGFFRVRSDGSRKLKDKYIESLLKFAEGRLAIEIVVDDVVAGFILACGRENRIVGGLLPEFQRQGIYHRARNTVIKYLNDQGIYLITFDVDKDNVKMLRLAERFVTTPYVDSTRLSHYDPTIDSIKIESTVPKYTAKIKQPPNLYHISLSSSLPDKLVPREPSVGSSTEEGLSEEDKMFSEFQGARVSMAPSPGLCYRGVYPNVFELFKGSKVKRIKLWIYKIKNPNYNKIITPTELINKRLVHDAHITLEYISEVPVNIELIGSMTVKNTEEGPKLRYRPFNDDSIRIWDHSPKSINLTQTQ